MGVWGAALLAVVLLSTATVAEEGPMTHRSDRVQVAGTCFKTGEQQSGMNKICFYQCAGSTAATTVSSALLCPLSIKQQ